MNFEIAPKETEIEAIWSDAVLYCASICIDGKSGWRLPTNAELYTISKSTNDFKKTWYWSSVESDNFHAFSQHFTTNMQSVHSKKLYANRVRAVRDL
jgi:hypothetical protein